MCVYNSRIYRGVIIYVCAVAFNAHKKSEDDLEQEKRVEEHVELQCRWPVRVCACMHQLGHEWAYTRLV